jgi:hypothetical protein
MEIIVKTIKILSAAVVAFSAFTGLAHAGQGFFITFESTGSEFPATTIGNIDYKDWYQNGVTQGASIPGSQKKTIYTEHCAAFFGCGSNEGDRSLADDGILWSLMTGTNHVVNFCLSNYMPISTTCGVQGQGGSQLIHDNWLAGCYVPGGGYTCTVTDMSQSGSQIAITYTLGLPAAAR